MIDVASHEQDIRGAVGQPGARDTEVIREMSGWLVTGLRPPVPMRVTFEDTQILIGPDGEPVLGLTTTRYEAFRWRMGRRSRGQLRRWIGPGTRPRSWITWWSSPAPVDVIE